MTERTTKYVTLSITAVLHGDYIDADEAASYLQGWVSAGLEDRDDLQDYDFSGWHVREVTGDPEGFDS